METADDVELSRGEEVTIVGDDRHDVRLRENGRLLVRATETETGKVDQRHFSLSPISSRSSVRFG